MAQHYEVIVGNVGTVYSGPSYQKAYLAFRDYYHQSIHGYGRAAGENVAFLKNGEITQEYTAGVGRTV